MPDDDRGDVRLPAEATSTMEVANGCLGPSLMAAYLHGSAVAGGLRPDSDVDLLLVVDRSLDDATRRCLLDGLLRVSGRYRRDDPVRPIELTVFARADLEPLSYPARGDFLYGEWLRDGFEAGALPRPKSDPEFTILLAQARRASVTLRGPAAHALLPAVTDRDLRCAIGDARLSLSAHLDGDERNVLLTFARMWRTLETGEIVPKDVAAAWAASRLSGPAASLMDRARLDYLGLVDDDWRDLCAEARDLADALNDRIGGLL